MLENITAHIDTILIIFSVFGGFFLLEKKITAQIDDLKADHNSLNQKVDNLSAQVNELKGTVTTILFIMRPNHAE